MRAEARAEDLDSRVTFLGQNLVTIVLTNPTSLITSSALIEFAKN